jgi:hypothetical protein
LKNGRISFSQLLSVDRRSQYTKFLANVVARPDIRTTRHQNKKIEAAVRSGEAASFASSHVSDTPGPDVHALSMRENGCQVDALAILAASAIVFL